MEILQCTRAGHTPIPYREENDSSPEIDMEEDI